MHWMNLAKVLLKFILKNHESLLMFSWKPVICVYTVCLISVQIKLSVRD